MTPKILHFKDLILSFKEFQSLAPPKAKEHCPVDSRHKGESYRDMCSA